MTSVLIRRRERDTRDAHAQRKGPVRTQQEDSRLQAKGREVSRETRPADSLILDFQPPEL